MIPDDTRNFYAVILQYKNIDPPFFQFERDLLPWIQFLRAHKLFLAFAGQNKIQDEIVYVYYNSALYVG